MPNPTNFLWEEPTWLEQVGNWIEHQLSVQNIKSIGGVEQIRVRHWS
jgi:hypothetical protein